MHFIKVRDKRLRRFLEGDDASGLPSAIVSKLRIILTVLSMARSVDEIASFPHWHPHLLSGDLEGYWSLRVTRNWRLIFQIEDMNIINLELVDYH